MSESKYADQAARTFHRKYPASAGWLVYQAENMTGLDLLPALLRSHADAKLLRESVWVKTAYRDGLRATPINYGAHPHVGTGPGLHDDEWYGQIDLLWRGEPLHFQRKCLIIPGLGSHHLTMVATKNRAMLEGLGAEMLRFWRETYNCERSIHITNGGSIPLPSATWDDLILAEPMRTEIKTNVEAFLGAREHYRAMGLPYRRGFLFVGSPGGGKSTAAKVIMANTSARCLALQLREDVKDATIEYAFHEAARETPSILLVEDLDRIVESRSVSLSFLLNLMDGLDGGEGFLMIATSNRPEKIDPALLQRPSRFDRLWQFGLPGPEERAQMLRLRSQGHFSDAAVAEASQASDGTTMAMVQEIAVSAMLQALHAGREPSDADLLGSVRRLKEQYRECQKVTGALPTLHKVGFNGDNR